MAEAMTGPGYFYAAINESQLLRAFGTFTIAAHIRNPGYRPTYSYGLARPISMNSLMQAWLIHGCRPGLL